jgi:glycosyltransferase involved in cell wall biosynthesis
VDDSDSARLVRDLARSLGCRRVIAIGAPRPDTAAGLRGELELSVFDPWEVSADLPGIGDSLLLCDGLLAGTSDDRPTVEALSNLLNAAPAGIASSPVEVGELTAQLEASGIGVDWVGLAGSPEDQLSRSWMLLALAGTRSAQVRDLLATGARSLRFDPAANAGERLDRPLRICIASYEFVGPTRTGGIGTAYTSLAESLAEAGHEVTVLYTGWRDPGDTRPFADWVGHYGERGIRLLELGSEGLPSVHCGHYNAQRSYLAYLWLAEQDRERPFDVVHFPDTLGHGYYAALAKRQGWAFERTEIAVGLHSPSRWILEANRVPFHTGQDFADDFLEQALAERADVLISPSAYIADWARSHGWSLPERSFVQQYVRSRAIERQAQVRPSPGGSEPIREIVFFGRLEVRKGLVLFCDAFDRLAARDALPRVSITFLGRQAEVEQQLALDYLSERAKDWPWEWQMLDQLTQPEAVAYLRAGGRLAVMPSLFDNTPNTVMEALALGIPFIASRAGGTAELIHPADLARASFDPGGPDGDVALADAIADAVAAERFEAPRPAVEAPANERAHLGWHAAIAAGGAPSAGERPIGPVAEPASLVTCCVVATDGEPASDSVESLRSQDHGEVEVVVARFANGRNDAVGDSRARWLLFLHPRAVAEPGLVSALIRHGEAAEAGVVTCSTRWLFADGGSALRVPEGGPALAGLFYKPFGDPAYAIRRELFERLGGFNPAAGKVADHELLCRAALEGARSEVVPEPLVRVPGSTPIEARATDYPDSAVAVVDVYRRALPAGLRDLPLAGRAFWQLRKRRDDVVVTLLESTSWRITKPMRRLSRLLRRLRGLPPGVEPE